MAVVGRTVLVWDRKAWSHRGWVRLLFPIFHFQLDGGEKPAWDFSPREGAAAGMLASGSRSTSACPGLEKVTEHLKPGRCCCAHA